MTPGEIVPPDALQTPAVLDAIRQAAMAANIPLGRLRIGSASNSINPETGMAEFDAQQIADGPMKETVVMGPARPSNLLNSAGGLSNAPTAECNPFRHGERPVRSYIEKHVEG